MFFGRDLSGAAPAGSWLPPIFRVAIDVFLFGFLIATSTSENPANYLGPTARKILHFSPINVQWFIVDKRS